MSAGLRARPRHVTAGAHNSHVPRHRHVEHKNVIGFIGTHTDGDLVYVFTEWAPGGSLRQMLRRFGPVSEGVLRTYARQALAGLAHLHDQGVVHGNIHPGNLLLGSDGVVKVADFDAACRLPPGVPGLEHGPTVREWIRFRAV